MWDAKKSLEWRANTIILWTLWYLCLQATHKKLAMVCSLQYCMEWSLQPNL